MAKTQVVDIFFVTNNVSVKQEIQPYKLYDI
jgi:hypothetical protein